MEISVSIESNPQRKREIQQNLTALLPDWFGQAKANLHYAEQAEVLTGYVAHIAGEAKGMLLLKRSSPISGEIYWIGVDPKYHRRGIGRALVEAACEDARASGIEYLFVCTLHPSETHEPYRRTRQFYEALGFQFVLEEQFPKEGNPLAYYMRRLV
jgi:ribosomal protein S18 acetylase RimI-like enzyme